ncbi:hypothetical protein [Alicyclobacillus fructus]|uniref:hypothetical protein n=1 Tax=Alicyclobacillus fructus TaxID=2816082 RepID=UPI001A908EEA|nr:hypothetical protein [Alicyclobacillus fructus]
MDHSINSLDLLRKIYSARLRERNIDAEKMISYMRQSYRQRVMNLVDAVAVACSVAEGMHTGIDVSSMTPQMKEAFHLQYPHLTFADLEQMSPEELQGVVNGWSGKLFEVVVRDKLNSGEWVGDVHLRPGQHAVLADSPVQPGWDLRIVNADGSTDEVLQLKATSSLSYVKSAVEQHPDIHVIATSDLFDHGSQLSDGLLDHLTNSEISHAKLQEAIHHTVNHAGGSGHFLHAILPELPFALISVTEIIDVFRGRKRIREAFSEGFSRSIKSGVVMAVVRGLELAGASTGVTIPVSFFMRLSMIRTSIFNRLTVKLEGRIREIRTWYQHSSLSSG